MEEEIRYWLGPHSWPQSLLKYVPYAEKFKDPARGHDRDYGLGGNLNNKLYIDYKFYIGMLKKSGFNPFDYVFSLFYFLLVLIFGFFFFNWRKNNVA